MKQEVELIRYLPEFLQGIGELRELFAAQEPEFMQLYGTADALLDNGFIMTADMQGIKRWERLVGISGTGADTEGRRAAVLGRWNSSLPYTMTRLFECLDILARGAKYRVLLSAGDCRLELVTENFPATVLRAMRELVREMLPANMLFVLADRIPGMASVSFGVRACLNMACAFYPRFNLPPHFLDGTAALDGGYSFNGCLADRGIDFYPAFLRMGCKAGEAWVVSAGIRTALCAAAGRKAKSGTALLVRGAGECSAGTAAGLQVAVGTGEAGWVGAGAHLRVEKAWDTLDGSVRMDGGRRLDAAVYEVEL